MLASEKIKWLGHASFQIKNSKTIYVDPWELKISDPADIILITHQHYDHCSPEDIAKIQKEDTVIIAPEDCVQKLSGNIKAIKPQEALDIEGVKIEATAAYNLNKAFHPKTNSWVGFIVSLDDTRIYHAGDTDLIPEMDNIKADIVLLPVGGTYTMNAKQAAECANKINPKVAIPMHYGSIVGSSANAEEFKKLCNAEVRILSKIG